MTDGKYAQLDQGKRKTVMIETLSHSATDGKYAQLDQGKRKSTPP